MWADKKRWKKKTGENQLVTLWKLFHQPPLLISFSLFKREPFPTNTLRKKPSIRQEIEPALSLSTTDLSPTNLVSRIQHLLKRQ